MAAARPIRLRDPRGFTLIELLIGLIVIGVLVGIAVPSFLLMRGRAEDPAARANVRATLPSLEAYFADNDTYAGATYAVLHDSYDAGLAPVSLSSLSDTGYCVEATVGSKTYSKAGPSAPLVQGSCP